MSVLLVSCAVHSRKIPDNERPVFSNKIADPEVKIIVDEYIRLSNENNVQFTDIVDIGFTKIDSNTIIGICSISNGIRKIYLDSQYWAEASWQSKVTLLFHELGHCYCGRPHDFGDGKMYPDNTLIAILQEYMARELYTPLRPKGYMDDGCPESIMHPTILTNTCFSEHYKYYTKEMFARCIPF